MAVFLSVDPDERTQVYRNVKRAYNFRSKVVHGDVIKQSKVNELIEVSLDCDRLLRQAIRKAILDESARKALEGTNENLDQYFLGLLFA